MKLFLILSCLILGGCLFHPGSIRTKAGTQLTPPANASASSTVDEGFTVDSITIPAGSRITVTEKPATAALPASKTTEIIFSKDTQRKVETKSTAVSVAAPRAPDKTVELAKLNNDERRPILWLAIALSLGAGALLYFQLPSFAEGAGILAVIAFGAWWALGHEALLGWFFGGLAALALGYFVYTEYRKAKIQKAANLAMGTVKNMVQSVQEMAVDAPHAINSLKQDYLSANLDAEQKALVSAVKPTIDTSYIQEAAAAKAASQPIAPAPAPAAVVINNP